MLKIAGAGDKATNQEAIDVYIPEEYFTEAGSGIKGYSFNNDGTGIAERIGGKLYLSIPYSKYHGLKSDTYYVYDNVGNVNEHSLSYDFDNQPPKIESISFVTKLDSSDQGNFCDAETGLGTQDGFTSFASVRFYTHKDKNSDNLEINKYYDNISQFKAGEVQEIYINKEDCVKFQVHFNSAIVGDADYLDDIKINICDDDTNKWVTVTSWKTNNTSWWVGDTDTGIRAMGTSDSTGYDKLTYTADGTYYQILATDISGNASCQYFKLYLDNAAPTAKPVVTLGKGSIGNIGSTYYYTADTDNPLKLTFAITDAGVGSKSELKKFKYSFDGTNWLPENGYITNPDNMELTFTGVDIETIYFMDIFENKTTEAASKPGFTYTNPNASSEADREVIIPKLTYYAPENSPSAPHITPGEIVQNYTSGGKQKKKTANIVEEIQTYGKGYTDSDLRNKSDTPSWTKVYTQLISTGTVLIKGEGNEFREKLKISFELPADDDNDEKIIGYLRIDNNSSPVTDTGTYSLKKFTTVTQGSKKYIVFTEDNLPLTTETDEDGNYLPVTLKYYAVDVVGNLSAPLSVIYSYNNPHKADNIELIEDPTHSTKIKADVLEQMQNDNLTFTKYFTVAGGPKGFKDGIRYFGDNYIVVRCSLFQKAGEEYLETPKSIELYDGYINTSNKMQYDLRGLSGTDFKIYVSEEDDKIGSRYYCYIAFRLDKFIPADNNIPSEATMRNNPGKIYNNDTYDGSVLYFQVTGETSSDYAQMVRENDTDTTKKYGWKIDNAAPSIVNTDFFAAGNDGIKKLKGYVIYDKQDTEVSSIPKAKDSYLEAGYDTNLYTRGSKIYYQVHLDNNNPYFKDDLTTVTKYKFVVTEQETRTSSAYTATASSGDDGWEDMVVGKTISQKGYYAFELPDITTPHCHIALFFMDGVGNVSEPYYLGDKNSENVQWWLLDNDPQNISITKDGTTELPVFDENVSTYVLNVAMEPGAVIRTITANDATVDSVVFNDYDGDAWNNGTDGNQPTYNKTGNDAGYFANRTPWLNMSSIKVTLTNVKKGWSNKTVKLIINDVPTTLFSITPKTLSSEDITIVDGNNEALPKDLTSSTAATEYTVKVQLPEGAGADQIAATNGITVDKATIKENSLSWNNNVATLVLTGITQSWTEADEVKLTITPAASGVPAIVRTVFNVTKRGLVADDITLGTKTWNDQGTVCTIPVTIADNGPLSLITGVTATNADSCSWDSTTGNITVTVSKTLAEKKVSLDIKSGDNTIKQFVDEITVEPRALAAGDISIVDGSDAAITWSNGISYMKVRVPKAITTLSVEAVSSNITLSNVGAAREEGDYTVSDVNFSITQGDAAADAVIKVNNIDITLFNVPAQEQQSGGGDSGNGGNGGADPQGAPSQTGNIITSGALSLYGGLSQSSKKSDPGILSFVTEVVSGEKQDEVAGTGTKKAAKAAKKAAKAAAKKAKSAAKAVVGDEAAVPVEAQAAAQIQSAAQETPLAQQAQATSATPAPQASVSVEVVPAAQAQTYDDPSATGKVLWVILAVLLGAAAAVTALVLRKKRG